MLETIVIKQGEKAYIIATILPDISFSAHKKAILYKNTPKKPTAIICSHCQIFNLGKRHPTK